MKDEKHYEEKKLKEILEIAECDRVARKVLEAFMKGERKVKIGKKTICSKPLLMKDFKRLLFRVIEKADREETYLIFRVLLKNGLIPNEV